jgi:hypothetical protein
MGRDEESVSIDLSTNVEMMARLKKWGCFIVGDSTRGTLAVSLQQDITLEIPRRVQGYRIHRSCGSPFKASNPSVAHGVGVPSDQIICELSTFQGRSSG